ncbi:MAG: hypothetical protein JWO63_886 [Frankiales bacterium]|nr:hypothetical protein [Frankiales bacterium]
MAASRSRHISQFIDRPAAIVYAFVSDPANLPIWASGVSSDIQQVGEEWVSESPFGPVTIRFAPANPFGVADHDVTVPDGETTHNPLRVLPDGQGSEVVFTLRDRPGQSELEYEADAANVVEDLARLRDVLEGRA